MSAYKKKTSRLAIAALVLGIVFWPAGLVVSILALRRLRRGQRGKALAIAGLVLSVLGALLTILTIAGAIALFDGGGDEPDDAAGAPGAPPAGTVSVFDLREGDCLDDVDPATIFVRRASCNKRHDGQIYTLIELPEGEYPGDKFLEGKAERGCAARMRRELPAPNVDPLVEIFYFLPSEDAWDSDERSIPCVAGFKKARLGSLLTKQT